jgi:hypothetical protein
MTAKTSKATAAAAPPPEDTINVGQGVAGADAAAGSRVDAPEASAVQPTGLAQDRTDVDPALRTDEAAAQAAAQAAVGGPVRTADLAGARLRQTGSDGFAVGDRAPNTKYLVFEGGYDEANAKVSDSPAPAGEPGRVLVQAGDVVTQAVAERLARG